MVKVYICHTPPDNINNAKTLSISAGDVADHLLNHSSDKLGENVEKNHVERCFRGQEIVEEDNLSVDLL
jgi:hypothetical protein